MRFGYTLDGAGWAVATLGDARQTVTMTASYLHDSLAQLANAVLELQAGQREAAVVFMDEPGEHHVVFRRQTDDAALVQVRRYEDWASWGMYPEEDYEIVFEVHSSLPEIKATVIAALRRILADHGQDGCKEMWVEHDFPVETYEKLLRD